VKDETVEFWFNCHIENKLIFDKYGISFTTLFQRRSGDVLTFIANTIITMMALCYSYDYTEAIGGVFGGDDSLVFFKQDYLIPDNTEQIAQTFNLTAKVENYKESMYFASKFFIFANDTWLLVPDPIK